jgi:hypothetical protein
MTKVVVTVLAAVLLVPVARPCSCEDLPIETKIERAAHVFRARVTSAEIVRLDPGEIDDFGGEFVKARVELLATLKGSPDSLDAVYTSAETSSCGVPIVIGLDYVLFLTERGVASSCGGTLQRGVGFFGSSGEWFEFVQRYGLAPISPDRF